jgi:hypothetical protein
MSNQEVLQTILKEDVFVPVLVFAGVVIVVLIRSVADIVSRVARERTRREIAAFIAEGSMTPEQGERLMKAGEH